MVKTLRGRKKIFETLSRDKEADITYQGHKMHKVIKLTRPLPKVVHGVTVAEVRRFFCGLSASPARMMAMKGIYDI